MLVSMQEKLNKLRDSDNYLILAIETSCDETAVAVTKGRAVLSSVINSQIDIHKKFGGVVPEIASREHVVNLDKVVEDALKEANITLKDIDVVAVTYGPGLLGALLAGVAYGKALAYALDIPLIAVNHILGHISASYIATPLLKTPFICLLASGGHTEILKIENPETIKILAETLDDAAGEAFDKVARVLGLPYPGGPEIEKLAKGGEPTYVLPRPFKGEKHLNFSFSGLKTAVINLVRNAESRGQEINKRDMAFSFQQEVAQVLTTNAIKAAKGQNIKTIVGAGGVIANTTLRETLLKEGEKNGIKILLPPKSLCTDNASMIGVAAHEMIKIGAKAAELNLDANPSLGV